MLVYRTVRVPTGGASWPSSPEADVLCSHSERCYTRSQSRWLLCLDVRWWWSDQLWFGYNLAPYVHPLLLRLLVQAHLQGLQVSQMCIIGVTL